MAKELDAPPLLEPLIHTIRQQRVMLDADLARLYRVSTGRFNEAFIRNRRRFPGDFSFQLTAEEYANLRSQIATSSSQPSNSKGKRENWPQFATSSSLRPGVPDPALQLNRSMMVWLGLP